MSERKLQRSYRAFERALIASVDPRSSSLNPLFTYEVPHLTRNSFIGFKHRYPSLGIFQKLTNFQWDVENCSGAAATQDIRRHNGLGAAKDARPRRLGSVFISCCCSLWPRVVTSNIVTLEAPTRRLNSQTLSRLQRLRVGTVVRQPRAMPSKLEKVDIALTGSCAYGFLIK